MTGSEPPVLRIIDLEGSERERAIPVIRDGFEGILRWHAKRVLREVPTVRAAELGRTVVGFALLERLEPEVGFVHYIGVERAHRREGIGAQLLDDALSGFRAAAVEVVYASVEADNHPSQSLFRSRGFRPTERKELSYREGGLGAWGLRSRMRVMSGEILFGLRISPPHPTLPREPGSGAE